AIAVKKTVEVVVHDVDAVIDVDDASEEQITTTRGSVKRKAAQIDVNAEAEEPESAEMIVAATAASTELSSAVKVPHYRRLPSAYSRTIESEVPDICKTEPCRLGIDEAGRGPVLGPMVYGTAFCPISKLDELRKMGFADSKVLKEEQRDALLEVIKDNNDIIAWNARVLSPQDICGSSLRKDKYNLNALSHDTAIALIRCALAKGANVTEIYVDTVGHAGKYQEKLEGLFPGKKIRVESKADAKYAVVSAASIVAKTLRDEEIRNFQFEESDMANVDRNFGSGYPGDPTTKAWLRNNMDPIFGFPGLVRFSWSTVTKLLDEHCAPTYMNDESEDEEEMVKGQKTLFECGAVAKTKKSRRHAFFDRRNFSLVSDF
ncbi:hypothetical protein SARC_10397, partial [Sphaeroforma arctica JP610]